MNFLRSKSFLIPFTFLASTSAFAVVAKQYISPKGAPEYVCSIHLEKFGSSPLNTPEHNCTGTLIRNNRILTAAHCLEALRTEDDISLSATCGNQMVGISNYVADPQYDPSNDIEDHIHDVATLATNGIVKKITPVAIAQTDNDVAAALAHPDNCFLYGYGNGDDTTAATWGQLRIAQFTVQTDVLVKDTGWKIPNDVIAGSTVHAAPGDSGGPILCSQPDGSFIQIATTMSRSIPAGGPLKGQAFSLHELIPANIAFINATSDLPKLKDSLPNQLKAAPNKK